EETGEIIFGRVDFIELFTIGKRKGLFSGEEIVKHQTTLTIIKNIQTICILLLFHRIAYGIVRHELPYYSKFLLISAFLASYNRTRDDTSIFSQHSGLKRKTR